MEIYHSYHAKDAYFRSYSSRRRKAFSRISKTLLDVSKILAIFGVSILIASFAPSVWFWAKTGGKNVVSKNLLQVVQKPQPITDSRKLTIDVYQPSFDPKLPLESRLKIPSAGINTPIREATADNFEEALKKGVWRISDFGTPYDRSKPTILAAHRYGYLAWSIPYRLKNSFYSLPKLKVGDTVEIIFRQSKYVYAVYAESKGDEISDYSADLIMYTCEALDSPVRIFKYARLLEI